MIDDFVLTHDHSTIKDVINNILRYVINQDPKFRHSILSGTAGAVESVGAAFDLFALAEHGFNRGLWEWSLVEFRQLLGYAHESQSHGLERLAHYKIAHCYRRIAATLRDDSLKSFDEHRWLRWVRSLEAADKALHASLKHNEQFAILGSNTSEVITYNNSCALSLRAQYTIERNLAHNTKEASRWAKMLHSIKVPNSATVPETVNRGKETDETVWKDHIGPHWRRKLSKEGLDHLEKVVDDYGSRSMKELELLVRDRQEAFRESDTTKVDLVIKRYLTDPDLMFMRNDGTFGARFSDLFDLYKEESNLDYFDKLWSNENEKIKNSHTL